MEIIAGKCERVRARRACYLEKIIYAITTLKRYLKLIMPIEDFELKEALGKGSFGCVCKCVRRSDG